MGSRRPQVLEDSRTDVRRRASIDESRDADTALDFLRALWELKHAMESASRVMHQRFGVSGPERLFIRVIGQNPGITAGKAAAILCVHPATATFTVKKLLRRRLLCRKQTPLDARRFQLRLTRAGERIDAMRAGTIEEIIREAIAESDPGEVAASSAMLVRIAGRLTLRMERDA